MGDFGMAIKNANEEYIEKAKLLSNEEAERLMSRMGKKLTKRLMKDKLSRDEALAIQLELEDEQLEEWREKLSEIKAKTKD